MRATLAARYWHDVLYFASLLLMLMCCEGLLFAVVVGVMIGIAVGFVFLLMVCVCKHRWVGRSTVSASHH